MTAPAVQALIAAAMARHHASAGAEAGAACALWPTTEEWIRKAADVALEGADDAARLAALRVPEAAAAVPGLQRQIEEWAAADTTGAGAFLCAVAASHNDLLCGNILLVDEGKPEQAVTFIDFEYAAFFARGFDLGNHLCECSGYECDFEAMYPARDVRRRLLAAYASAAGQDASDAFLDAMDVGVALYAEASCLFWGMWAVVQASISKIDFDFVNYGLLKFAGHYWLRERPPIAGAGAGEPRTLKEVHDALGGAAPPAEA
jgi:thiamine kinase-like enzyme